MCAGVWRYALEIRIGRAVVNVSGMVDAGMLRTVLESLRR
jgi:hypothetical protein